MTTTDLEWARGVARRIRLIEPPAARAIEQLCAEVERLDESLREAQEWVENVVAANFRRVGQEPVTFDSFIGMAVADCIEGDTP